MRLGYGCAWNPMFGSTWLVHAELPEHPLSPLVEDLVERWDHDEREQSRRNHSTDHRATERRTELGAFADSQRHRDHAGDQRQCRHHDWTQTNRAGFDQRFAPWQSVLLTGPLGEV